MSPTNPSGEGSYILTPLSFCRMHGISESTYYALIAYMKRANANAMVIEGPHLRFRTVEKAP